MIFSLSACETDDVFRLGVRTTPATVKRSVGLAQRSVISAVLRLAGTATACGFTCPAEVNVSVEVWAGVPGAAAPVQSAPPMLSVANVPS